MIARMRILLRAFRLDRGAGNDSTRTRSLGVDEERIERRLGALGATEATGVFPGAGRPVERALVEWRHAERRLDELPPNAPGREELTLEVERLRQEHARRFDAAADKASDRAQRPSP